ncbi:MAG: acyl carrier protein [Rhizobiales bacterium]|nr:acyl carrier protein [Hyphomicrobiales bacterium]
MERINDIIGSIFECNGAALADDDNPESVEKWDSVTHIMVLSALEEELGVKFSDSQMENIHTIGEIRAATAAQLRR